MVIAEAMSLCDPYLELELYLEQAKDEITKVFEQWTPALGEDQPALTNGDQQKQWESDENFLLQFDSIIDSDIKELYNRYKDKGNVGADNETENFIGNDCYGLEDSILVRELNGSQSTISSTEPLQFVLSGIVPVDTATQTSPTPSHSSTNLTWASDCSSSPCLTSTSEVEAAEEDNRSSSSADCLEQDAGPWILMRQWQKELGSKSSSAPVLKRAAKVNRQTRSQSDRHLADEIEATEACKWLRAAGFPQYAQMYEDMEFPIDVAAAAQDHPRLERAVLNSLFRRLQVLNRCARVYQQRIPHTDDSEDEQCALSDKWTFQSGSRRWSRNCQNIELPCLDNANNKEWWCATTSCHKNQAKERLKRAGSTKYRRRREGVVISDSGSNVLDILSKELSEVSIAQPTHASDSECTPRNSRRRKTRSLDKCDTWSSPPATPERTLWHLQKAEEATEAAASAPAEGTGKYIYSLSCAQLQVLRKLALLKLTAHMEKYCPSHRTGWNWDLPKFIKKIKAPAYKDHAIFGVPLTVILQKIGQCLPKSIEEALIWLRQNAADQVGLFRKPGVKSRIQMLRNLVETQESVCFNEHQPYDVADMVKQYFRDLPEVLLTNKLSETFILIFQYVPPFLRREAVLCALLLMPDEHTEVLHVLLDFLQHVASHASVNQMNESNLATCFAPSLFHYSQSSSIKQGLGSPHPRELAENRAAHDCLLFLLKNFRKLYTIPNEFINQCKAAGEMNDSRVVQLSELGSDMNKGWRGYLADCQSALQKEAREKGRGWIVVTGHNSKVEIAYKKVADGYPLRLWKVSAEIEAPPLEVLHRLLRERHKWDLDLQTARIVAQIDKSCEVFQFVRRRMESLPNEEYCVVRCWQTDLKKGACSIVETSVEHPDAMIIPDSARGIVLASRYLIEPCGSGKSRLLHLSRVDTRGRMPEWYHKNFGHVNGIFVANIQSSFQQNATGPESKV